MTSTAILIPARFKSSRFPGKPLVNLGGIPMIKRVYEACAKTGLDTYVLTDDWSIAQLFNDNNCIFFVTAVFAYLCPFFRRGIPNIL